MISTVGVDGQFTVTIVSTPAGTPVSGSTNTFDYPILSSVTLTCMVDPSPPGNVTHQWDIRGCYANIHGERRCFPDGQVTQSVTSNNLLAKDAGTITCIAIIDGVYYTSGPFTLRISGIHILLICNVAIWMWVCIYIVCFGTLSHAICLVLSLAPIYTKTA